MEKQDETKAKQDDEVPRPSLPDMTVSLPDVEGAVEEIDKQIKEVTGQDEKMPDVRKEDKRQDN